MTAGRTLTLALLLLAWAVWFGGLVTIAVVTVSARRTLDPVARVDFLRDLGRRYLPVGTGALVLSLLAGLALLVQQPWSLASTVAVLLGIALAAALAVGVVQARRMTRLRVTAAGTHPGTAGVPTEVEMGARRAAVLRGGIVVLTLALFVVALLAAS